jgi:hypothetical protein
LPRQALEQQAMVFQRDKGSPIDSFETGLPPAESGEDVPRWLVILGLVAALTLLVALLRYAIDLLGVVFIIILVGFSIRALSDWLTEGESVSGWAMSALSLGLMGTVLVGLWLFNSRADASDALQRRLPGPIHRTVSWLEAQGWGQRVLLPGGSSAVVAVSNPPASGPSDPPDKGEPVRMAAQPEPSLPVVTAPARPRVPPQRRAPAPGEAEASTQARQAAASPPAPSEAPPVAVATSITLSVSPAQTVVGRSVRLTALVRPVGAESTPTGTVAFSADGALLGRGSVRGGTAILVTLNLAIGDHVLSAAYEGDRTHQPSHSAPITQTVARK